MFLKLFSKYMVGVWCLSLPCKDIHRQTLLVCNFVLNGVILWPFETDAATLYICKEAQEDNVRPSWAALSLRLTWNF